MALVDVNVFHDHVSQIADDPQKDVSSGEWNHHHRVDEGAITYAMLSAAAQAGAVRTTAQYTSATLANLAVETGTITMTKGYRLSYIQTSRAARVRVYVTSSQRTSDATRTTGVFPSGNHGVVLDFVTTGSMLEADLCPPADGYCASSSIPISITNLGTSGTVVLTLTYTPTEV